MAPLPVKVSAAIRSALEAYARYDERDQSPNRERWGDYSARLSRYALADAYYFNTAYSTISALAISMREVNSLYRYTRGIYNPVYRLVQTLANFGYGGPVDVMTFEGGTLPLDFANKSLLPALRNTFQWSRLAQTKMHFARSLCRYGDAFWKVAVSLPSEANPSGRVRLELLPAAFVRRVSYNSVGDITAITIEYMAQDEQPHKPTPVSQTPFTDVVDTLRSANNRPYVKTEIITKQRWETYRDGELYAYPENVDPSGKALAEWDNPYGFVPVAHGAFETSSDGFWGVSAFGGGALVKINEANDLASLTDDQIRKTVEPIMLIKGGNQARLELELRGKDEVPYVNVPKDVNIDWLLATLDVAGSMAALEGIIAELERDLPELSLAKIRDMGNMTAPGVLAGFGDAIARVKNLRINGDDAMVRGLQMGLTMGGVHGVQGFEGITQESYDAGDLALEIAERPVISDVLSKVERVTAMAQVANLPPALMRVVLRELDVDQETIDAVVDDSEATARNALKEFGDAILGSTNTPPNSNGANLNGAQNEQSPAAFAG